MTNAVDIQYLNVMETILKEGDARLARNGIRHTLFGTQMGFNMADGFPILTTKFVSLKNVAAELCWFLKGGTNIKYLHDHNVHIWDEWADKDGELGPVYGRQWRSWEHIEYIDPNGHPSYEHNTIDQIDRLVKGLVKDPYGTRHVVTAWNPAELDKMALPPCHMIFQFDVTTSGYLNLHLYQRSADWFLGVPYNITSYALLLHIIAEKVRLTPGMFIHSFGNYHLYDNHKAQAWEQLGRSPHHLPTLVIDPVVKDIDLRDLEPDYFLLDDYVHHPAIKAPISK